MKRFFLFLISRLLPFTGGFFLAHSAIAATYRLGEPLPGADSTVSTFGEYLSAFFPFTLSITAALALIVFVYGGIRYAASAGSQDSITNAKSRIWGAIGGLVLAALSVLILRTINPNLVELQLSPEEITVNDNTGYNFPKTDSSDQFKVCNVDADCNSRICAPLAGTPTCVPNNVPSGGTCGVDRQCVSGACKGFFTKTCE